MLSRQAPFGRRTARATARPLRAFALAALAVLLAAGCGGDDRQDGGEEPRTSLEVTLDADGTGAEKPQVSQVSCPGSGACAALDQLSRADLSPVPPTTACTEIFGGPDTVTIEGELDGEAVQARLNRSNGCEIERFGRFLPVLESLFEGYEPGSALRP